MKEIRYFTNADTLANICAQIINKVNKPINYCGLQN